MDMECAKFLSAGLSEETAVRSTVPDKLKKLQQENLPQFLLSLSLELSNEDKSLESRRLAGILLNNSLDVKDVTTNWVNMDNLIKNQIKDLLLNTLSSSISEAAQVIAKIASIDIPRNDWPNLIASLLENMSKQDNPTLKQATLESLGYVCEEISHDHLAKGQVDLVLTAVVKGMDVSQQSSVRLAAVTALYNALNFARTNFAIEKERKQIMDAVCEAARAEEADIRRKAFECLVSIASTYYEFLKTDIGTLYDLTTKAFEDEENSVGIQAIEFWSCIYDEEIKRRGDIKSGPHFHFIKWVYLALVELLLITLMKQDKDKEGSICDLSLAGGKCLGLIARKVGDSIVESVMIFVKFKLIEHKSKWRTHWAGTYALGSILEGPSVEKLSPNVLPILRFLGDKNSHVNVKQITAWSTPYFRVFTQPCH